MTSTVRWNWCDCCFREGSTEGFAPLEGWSYLTTGRWDEEYQAPIVELWCDLCLELYDSQDEEPEQ